MKYHFIIKTRTNFDRSFSEKAPYWKDLINDKSKAVEHFFPAFDQLFKKYNLSFWLTREFQPQHRDWSVQEVDNDLDRIYRVILQDDYDYPDSLVKEIRLLPLIEEADELKVAEAQLPQPQLAVQASFGMAKPSDLIYLPYAQLITKGIPEITIAVLDTGVNLDHKELTGKLVKPADFVNLAGLDTKDFIGDVLDYDDVPEDEVGHGTHVSGIIASKGIEMDEGICPGCKIMPVRVLATMKNGDKIVGAGIIDNINTGIKYAVDHGADIINMSLGIRHAGGGLPHEDVVNYALSKNVTIVAASGNDGTEEKYYPGALPGVIAVGAVDGSGMVAPFTSYGANITVVGPGLHIYSSYTHNTYAYATGTSQASPFVCGAIGLMKSYAKQLGKSLSNDMIMYVLRNSSDRVDNHMRNQKAGYGLINLTDAFKLLHYLIH